MTSDYISPTELKEQFLRTKKKFLPTQWKTLALENEENPNSKLLQVKSNSVTRTGKRRAL